jgi:hypothetical protein
VPGRAFAGRRNRRLPFSSFTSHFVMRWKGKTMILHVWRQALLFLSTLIAAVAHIFAITALTFLVTGRDGSTVAAIGCPSGTHWDHFLRSCR